MAPPKTRASCSLSVVDLLDRPFLKSSCTCRAGDDGKARQNTIETAENHGFEVVSLFTVRFVMGLTCSSIMKEPGTKEREQRNKLQRVTTLSL